MKSDPSKLHPYELYWLTVCSDTLFQIIFAVTGFTKQQLLEKSNKKATDAKRVFFVLMKEEFPLISDAMLGFIVGRDHATVYQTVLKHSEKNNKTYQDWYKLIKLIFKMRIEKRTDIVEQESYSLNEVLLLFKRFGIELKVNKKRIPRALVRHECSVNKLKRPHFRRRFLLHVEFPTSPCLLKKWWYSQNKFTI